MRHLSKTMKRHIKSLLITWLCSAMGWVSDRIIGPSEGLCFRFYFGWWITHRLEYLFGLAYEGSAEEIQLGIEAAIDGTDEKYLTPNQIEIKRRLCEFVDVEVER
jgi:hypothetical protein